MNQGKDEMVMQGCLRSVDATPMPPQFAIPPRTIASYEFELTCRRKLETQLRETLAKGEALLHQKDEAIEYQALMRRESDHRLLNDMQIVVSMLSMQSRASSNAETAAQLVVAANRIAMIARIHQHLHGFDGMQTVAFRKYLNEFCREFSAMLSCQEAGERVVVADGAEIELPATTAIPLAFVVSELLTNAVKHGDGRIDVCLEAKAGKDYLLSVSNAGPALPEDFDPTKCTGLGMKIIQSFIRKIGGELCFGPGENGVGAHFSVSFA